MLYFKLLINTSRPWRQAIFFTKKLGAMGGKQFCNKNGWRPWRDTILYKKILCATGGKDFFTKNTLPPVSAKYFIFLLLTYRFDIIFKIYYQLWFGVTVGRFEVGWLFSTKVNWENRIFGYHKTVFGTRNPPDEMCC
jgi:hypothetical protein